MKKYQIFFYDKEVKTNYIEKLIEVRNQLDLYNELIFDADLDKEIKRKFKYVKNINDIYNNRCFEINSIK